MSDDHDPIAEVERLDRFFDGEEEGERPIDVLRARGITIPDGAALDDESLRAKLWEVINAMGSIGMYLESTDHLSDRELYRHLVTDALCEADDSSSRRIRQRMAPQSDRRLQRRRQRNLSSLLRRRRHAPALADQFQRADSCERKASLGSRSIPSATRHACGRRDPMRISIEEAQAKLTDLIHRLHFGEEIVITENDEPVARLVPVPSESIRKPRQPGMLKGSVLYMAPDFDAPLEDFRDYMT